MKPNLFAVALACLLGVLGCVDSQRQGDVLLISVDTLRPDHLGIYGYGRPTSPNIDRWFRQSAVYERAYTTDANTSPAVISMLSGLLPQEHGVRLLMQIADPELRLLPDMLPDSYQTVAFVSNMVLGDEAVGIGSRFDHYDDFVDERESDRLVFERNATRTTDAALAWLRDHLEEDRPVFLWVHYIDPHGPYRPPQSWEKSFGHDEAVHIDPNRVPAYQREPGVDDGLTYVDLYDEEIAYTDSEVARLLTGYAAARSVDDSLVIFTADHGESMMEHEKWFTHGSRVYEEFVRVPLILRGPGVRAGRRQTVVSLVDVAPTILRFAGAKIPETLGGMDLLDDSEASPSRVVYVEARGGLGLQRRAAIMRDEKWTLSIPPDNGAPQELRRFDLKADSAEQFPMSWIPGTEKAHGLLDLVERDPDPAGFPERYTQGMLLKGPKVAPDAPRQAIDRLRALGYTE